MGLLEWLQHYTFPMEKTLAHDADKAREAYERVVETTLAWGTTAAAYYATIGRKTSEILCDVAENFGQRALVGKVSTKFVKNLKSLLNFKKVVLMLTFNLESRCNKKGL